MNMGGMNMGGRRLLWIEDFDSKGGLKFSTVFDNVYPQLIIFMWRF